jgi:hypothetical protein
MAAPTVETLCSLMIQILDGQADIMADVREIKSILAAIRGDLRQTDRWLSAMRRNLFGLGTTSGSF